MLYCKPLTAAGSLKFPKPKFQPASAALLMWEYPQSHHPEIVAVG